MNNKKPLPAIVNFAVLTTITTFVWIGFEIYRAVTKEPSPPVPPEILLELDPNLDTAKLNELNERVHLQESELGETLITNLDNQPPEPTPTATPLPTEAPSQEATGEAQETGEATEEGTVSQ